MFSKSKEELELDIVKEQSKYTIKPYHGQMKKLCSRCARVLGYLIQYPQMLKPYHKCSNCGSDRRSWSEEAIKEQIRILK